MSIKANAGLAQYKYAPLQQGKIRVLDVEPAGAFSSELMCRMRTVKAPTNGTYSEATYIALSYTWGQTFLDGSHLNETVVCDGRTLAITSNLHQVLRRIREKMQDEPLRGRYSDQPSSIWVDAICINQRDVEERTQQVSMMADIYSRAHIVLIWLGECHSSESTLHSYMKQANKRESYPGIAPSESSNLSPAMRSILKRGSVYDMLSVPILSFDDAAVDASTIQDDSEYSLFTALQHLLNKPWFQRRWVVQEYKSAPESVRYVLIGDALVPASTLKTLLAGCGLLPYAGPFQLQSSVARRAARRSLLQNLSTFEETQCSDPRDRAIALLSLSEDANTFRFNYKQSTEEIYGTVAKHYLLQLDLAQNASFRKQKKKARLWDGYDVSRTTRREDVMNALCVLTSAIARPRIQNHVDMSPLPWWAPDWRLGPSYVAKEHEFATKEANRRGLQGDAHSSSTNAILSDELTKDWSQWTLDGRSVLNDDGIGLLGLAVAACFPPKSTHIDASPGCECCKLCAGIWTEWSSELKDRLSGASSASHVLFVCYGTKLVFVTEPHQQERRAAFGYFKRHKGFDHKLRRPLFCFLLPDPDPGSITLLKKTETVLIDL